MIYYSLLISQCFPFQMEKFKNIFIFNFQRPLLLDNTLDENVNI